VWHFDEPFGDSSAVPTYYVSRMARQKVTVVLSGDGGDELFAGYNHYRMALDLDRWRALPRFLRKGLIGPVSRALPISAKGKFLLHGMANLEEKQNWDAPEMYPPIKGDLFSAELARKLRGVEPAASSLRYWGAAPAGPSLSRMQYLDTKVYLPEDILMKVDRMSMANSLETRAPLLDYNIVEFAATIPRELQRKDGRGKYILRRALERLLPAETLKKPKQGFAIPREKWFQGALKDYAWDTLTSKRFSERGLFKDGVVRLILKEHAEGARDYSMWIWCLLNFELWHRCFLDGDTRRV
jgi:asparagine synthase (glutamine-hydrolysing)